MMALQALKVRLWLQLGPCLSITIIYSISRSVLVFAKPSRTLSRSLFQQFSPTSPPPLGGPSTPTRNLISSPGSRDSNPTGVSQKENSNCVWQHERQSCRSLFWINDIAHGLQFNVDPECKSKRSCRTIQFRISSESSSKFLICQILWRTSAMDKASLKTNMMSTHVLHTWIFPWRVYTCIQQHPLHALWGNYAAWQKISQEEGVNQWIKRCNDIIWVLQLKEESTNVCLPLIINTTHNLHGI